MNFKFHERDRKIGSRGKKIWIKKNDWHKFVIYKNKIESGVEIELLEEKNIYKLEDVTRKILNT